MQNPAQKAGFCNFGNYNSPSEKCQNQVFKADNLFPFVKIRYSIVKIYAKKLCYMT